MQAIDPLPPIDHSEIEYSQFTKNFYEEHEDISNMTPDQMIELRKKLGISVCSPCFQHFVLLLQVEFKKYWTEEEIVTWQVFDCHVAQF